MGVLRHGELRKSCPGSKSWVNTLAGPLSLSAMYTNMGKQKRLPTLGLPMTGPTASPCSDFPFWLRRGAKFDTSKSLNHGICPRIFPERLTRTLASFKYLFVFLFSFNKPLKLLSRSIIHTIVYLRGPRLYAAPPHLLSIVPLATHVPVRYPDPPLRP